MCGRYAFFSPAEAVRRTFELDLLPELEPRYNIAPTQTVVAVRAARGGEGREFVRLSWRLIPSWAKDAGITSKLIDARGETLTEKPSFREAFRRRSCQHHDGAERISGPAP
jgi:putative SOS response-associated peptidase YedK